MMSDKRENTVNIARVIAGDVASWMGLRAHCIIDELVVDLAPVTRVTREAGSRNGRRFSVVNIERSLPAGRVELWVPEEEEYVTVIECANPSIENLEKTLMGWGPPEWVLDEKRFVRDAIITERVYASRGITLSVAESSFDPAHRSLAVVNLQLYRPLSVESYLADIGAIGLFDSQVRSAHNGLEKALAGDLLEWRGLSGFETVETVAEAVKPFRRSYAPVEKERMNHRFSVLTLDRLAPPSPLELWVLTGQDFVSLVEYDDPPVVGLEQTLATVGPPELLLEGRRFAVGASVMEYVYPSRGLSLSVAVPHEGSPLQSRRITHVQLYRASSTRYYWRYIGPGTELHPCPNPPERLAANHQLEVLP